jgi:hypothetical protein
VNESQAQAAGADHFDPTRLSFRQARQHDIPALNTFDEVDKDPFLHLPIPMTEPSSGIGYDLLMMGTDLDPAKRLIGLAAINYNGVSVHLLGIELSQPEAAQGSRIYMLDYLANVALRLHASVITVTVPEDRILETGECIRRAGYKAKHYDRELKEWHFAYFLPRTNAV